MTWRRSATGWLVLCLLMLGCGGHDYEVRVLGRDQTPPPSWQTMAFDELHPDATCTPSAGKVAFRRPAYSTSLAARTCYENGRGRVIAVPLRLPEASWVRAGWQRCTSQHRHALKHACR